MGGGSLLEVCVDRVSDALAAKEAGADRIELCGALELGGLTPSIGLIEQVVEQTGLEVLVMLRPRAGGFDYDESDLRVAWRDAEQALSAGAAGLVFGCLHADGTVQTSACRQFVQLAQGKTTVFHRAFDFVPSPLSALEELVAAGISRILTSGQQPVAAAGAALIKQLVQQAAGRIEILPGGGVTADNAARLLQMTGCDQLHMSGSTIASDLSLHRNAWIGTRDAREFGAGDYRATDAAKVVRARQAVIR